MKKILLAAIITFSPSLLPDQSIAGPPPPSGGGAVALGLVALFGGGSSASKPTNTEFAQLNQYPSTKSLINQAASGALNTAEIIKQQ